MTPDKTTVEQALTQIEEVVSTLGGYGLGKDEDEHAIAVLREVVAHLQALVTALDGAYISSWQSTAHWVDELSAARDYLDRNRSQSNDH